MCVLIYQAKLLWPLEFQKTTNYYGRFFSFFPFLCTLQSWYAKNFLCVHVCVCVCVCVCVRACVRIGVYRHL
jgi:hypothetical protein